MSGAQQLSESRQRSRSPEAQERSVLRWGGVAGMAGSLVLVVVFAVVIVFVGMEPVGPEEAVERFPGIRVARTVENGLYLLALVLWVVHILALHRALRGTSLVPALVGSASSLVGLVLLAAGALPHVASIPIADLYHAPATTAADQAALVLAWQVTEGLFDALLVAGMVVLPIGLVALGAAMRRTPAFGRGLGRTTVALGLVGVAGAAVQLVDPGSLVGVVVLLGAVAFHAVVGARTYRLAKV